MKRLVGQKTFSGPWMENLDSMVGVYAPTVTAYEMTEENKLKAILVMLAGDNIL